MLILITVSASWLAYRANIARVERPAIALLREHGCQTLYQHQIMGSLPSFAPAFLRQRFGEEFFGRVVRLNFAKHMPEVDDALSLVPNLTAVTVINTENSGLTDEGMKSIAQLENLTTLRLPDASITDKGLIHLSNLKNLQMLDLGGNTQITNAGIKHLAKLTNLEFLTLSKTNISDDGLRHLYGLKRLRYLQVQQTLVTQKGLARLKQKLPDL